MFAGVITYMDASKSTRSPPYPLYSRSLCHSLSLPLHTSSPSSIFALTHPLRTYIHTFMHKDMARMGYSPVYRVGVSPVQHLPRLLLAHVAAADVAPTCTVHFAPEYLDLELPLHLLLVFESQPFKVSLCAPLLLRSGTQRCKPCLFVPCMYHLCECVSTCMWHER